MTSRGPEADEGVHPTGMHDSLIPLKAVIFDYGKVLSHPQSDQNMAAIAKAAGMPVERMHGQYWRYRTAFDRGDLSVEAYWKAVSSDLTSEQVREIIRLDNESWSRPNPAMVRWAATLRAKGIRTGVLSNMPVTLRGHVMAEVEWLRGFDQYTFSCDVNLVKPEEGIYRHALAALGVAAEEALFLDDREDNVEGARRAGLHALTFHDAGQANGEIQGRYALPAIELQ